MYITLRNGTYSSIRNRLSRINLQRKQSGYN